MTWTDVKDYADRAVELVIDCWFPILVVLLIGAVAAVGTAWHLTSHEVCGTVREAACVPSGGWMGGVRCRVVTVGGHRTRRTLMTIAGDRVCWREANP